MYSHKKVSGGLSQQIVINNRKDVYERPKKFPESLTRPGPWLLFQKFLMGFSFDCCYELLREP